MSHTGGLTLRRPDQYYAETPRGVQPGARITRLGGTPQSASASVNGAQLPTVFYTFTRRGRIFSAQISFAAGTDSSYSAAVQQLYARVSTVSGIFLGIVRLAVCGPNQPVNGPGGIVGPEAGIPVAAGDQLQLDVNNGVSITGGFGLMGADCTVFFTLP